jgi:predicted alpha/beta hydrolase family esterase
MQSAIKVVLAPGNGCGDADLEDVMWYGWMQRKLQEAGIACRLQSFPDPNMAKESVWLPFLREELLVDDNTVLIGHSSGAVAALRLAEQQKIGGVVLVSAYDTGT